MGDANDAMFSYGGYGDLASRRKNATRESTATLKAWLNEHKKNPYNFHHHQHKSRLLHHWEFQFDCLETGSGPVVVWSLDTRNIIQFSLDIIRAGIKVLWHGGDKWWGRTNELVHELANIVTHENQKSLLLPQSHSLIWISHERCWCWCWGK